MIKNIKIKNFRCFSETTIDRCRRINVIVGDNSSGKTALLEAIFLALGNSPELGVRFRQYRGLEGLFSGPTREIEDAIWRDLFRNRDWSKTVSVILSGDGPECRSVELTRGSAQLSIPLSMPLSEGGQKAETTISPIRFTWRDHLGNERSTSPKVTSKGIEIESSPEDLPTFMYFPAAHLALSGETARRFSALSLQGDESRLTDMVRQVYPIIEGLSVEVPGGSQAVYAKLKDQQWKVPLSYVSGAIDRIVSVMVGIATNPKTVMLVDEIENGIYYQRHEPLCRTLLSAIREYDSQIFLTTHSAEWLSSFVNAAGATMDDVALWRVERGDEQPIVRQFVGKKVASAIKSGEVR